VIARTFSEWQNGLYRVTMTDCTILLLLVSGMRHRSRREPAIQADQLVGLAIATIASACFLWTTDETLRKTLEVNQRPWISVDTTIVGPFTIDEKGGYVRLKIEIKNVGLSMADDVRIFPVIYPDKIDNISIEEIQETRCRKPRNKSSHGSLAFTLFPGQSKIEIDAPGLTSEDIQHIRVSDRKKISPAIVICVSYVASITRRIYFSTALFGLYERTSVGSDQIVPVLLGDIPVQPERLYLMPFGSFAE
jgi:hypothetical protein